MLPPDIKFAVRLRRCQFTTGKRLFHPALRVWSAEARKFGSTGAPGAIIRVISGATRALHDVLHAATFTPEPLPAPAPGTRLDVPEDGTFVSIRLGGGPVILQTRGRALTLRREDGEDPVVILPGRPAVPLRDLLVLELPGAQVLLARQGSWVAAAVEPLVRGG